MKITYGSTAGGGTAPMSLEELLALPVTVNVHTAARALGIAEKKAYQLLRSRTFPVRTLPMGSVTRVPSAALWEALGVTHLLAQRISSQVSG